MFTRSILTILVVISLALPTARAFADDGIPSSDPEISASQEVTSNSVVVSDGQTGQPDENPQETVAPEKELTPEGGTELEQETVQEPENASEPEAAQANPEVSLEPVVDYLAENNIVLSDASGDSIPLTAAVVADVLTVPDPWIMRSGTTYRFLAPGGCAAYGGVSATCVESSTPVQAAIDFADPGETINIEGGDYLEDVTIFDANLNLIGYNGIAYLNSITLNANVGAISNVLSPILYVNQGASIQDGIDLVESDGTVFIAPGTYNETATGRYVGTNGPHQFGLFIGKEKKGITLQGLSAGGTPVTHYSETGAYITTNATNNFGYSGIFVEGDDVTINGLIVGDNLPYNNKTIEVVGNNFSFLNNRVVAEAGALYFDDWYFDKVNDVSHLQSYLIRGNSFERGSQIAITSGAGYSGSDDGRRIIGNHFNGEIEQGSNANYALLSFSGRVPTVGWFVTPVGGAVISGNTFENSPQYVRARGIYHEDQFDWQSIWCDNEFYNGLITLMDPSTFTVRPFTYSSGPYIFENVRRIGSDLTSEQNISQDGDLILTEELCTELGLCPDSGGDTGGTGGGGKTTDPTALPSAIIPVTGGLMPLSCDIANLLELPDGRQLVFGDVLCEYMAGFEDRPLSILEQEIPVQIPEYLKYQSGVVVSLVKGETVFEDIPTGVDVVLRFPMSKEQSEQQYQILRWNPLLKEGLGDWEEVSGSFVEKVSKTEYFLSLPLLKTGTYVLTSR
jgi:hypothetical protein